MLRPACAEYDSSEGRSAPGGFALFDSSPVRPDSSPVRRTSSRRSAKAARAKPARAASIDGMERGVCMLTNARKAFGFPVHKARLGAPFALPCPLILV